MSEYWKSNPRKFCDFCKCWITDNKPSIEFHERGKRHKQNVQNRITEVRKSSEKKAKEKAELQNDLQKMERAALAAFKKDLENNPALAQQYKAKAQAAREAHKVRDEKKSNKSSEKEVKSLPIQDDREGVWYEALSPEGYPYYWNDKTNEPVWEAPEKYVSLAEQELQQQQGLDVVEKEEEETATVDTPLPVDTNDIPLPESPVVCEKSEPNDISSIAPTQPSIHKDPFRSAQSAYGGWETVSVAEVPEDLPVEDIPLPESPKEAKPVKQKFREKTVTSLSTKPGEVVTFKKRKVAAGARNTRRRDSDD